MFERRLKIVLGILLGLMSILLLRAFQLQVFGRSYWVQAAEDFARRPIYLETTRGRILDHNNSELAVDQSCTDACVDYRAISRNEKWIKNLAARRLLARLSDQYRKATQADRQALLADEVTVVNREIDRMWDLLAEVSGQTPAQIEEIRSAIDLKVAHRVRDLQYKRYQGADKEYEERGPGPWYQRWIIEGGEGGPNVDDFEQEFTEESQAHPILHDISPDVYMRLAKQSPNCPGLVLRPGTSRRYPYGRGGAHVIGYLTAVDENDLKSNRADDSTPDPRAYQFTDAIGRAGVERLAERSLRGARGMVYRRSGRDDEMLRPAEPGRDIKTTIDIELQTEIQQLFANMSVPSNKDDHAAPIPASMHGAAVVIDVRTGQVRALASYPDFDPSNLTEKFPTLDAPFMNRATQFQLVPGSTIKPAIGLSGIGQGVITPTEGIECTGYLVIDGHEHRNGRCWTATKFERLRGRKGIAHHSIPEAAPHKGIYNNRDGFLCFQDALERSCNIYFENVADRLGLNHLCTWLDKFGFGHETGIGIAEARGLLPNRGPDGGGGAFDPSTLWFAGMGQGSIEATPLQMANLAATIARGGVWMRPLLVETPDAQLDPVRPRDGRTIPDRVDLKLSPEALSAVREGMTRVVNSDAGTGTKAFMPNLLVAGKTGTAEAHPILLDVLDAQGNPTRDKQGYKIKQKLPVATADQPTDTPWYRGWGPDGSQLNHAWFIGYAPADNPQVAFSILIEYGGSGGLAAETAPKILEKCIEHGYVK